MARRKKSDGGGSDTGAWLNTYADMVTLLLTFFILLFSMSSLDAAKFNMLVVAFASDRDSSEKIILRGEATGDTQTGSSSLQQDADPNEVVDLEEIFQYLQQKVQEQGLQDSVQVSMGDGYVFVRFMDNMLFLPNSPDLRPESREILGMVGESIKSVQRGAKSINIVGHTASVPDNPDYEVSDRILSTNRANAVLMFFEDDIGLDSEKMFATGYGKWTPIADNDTEEGRQQNRRVEILISSESNSLSEQLNNVYEQLVK